ncbi:hypothetical protein [Actinoallomurus sp. NPDC052274]|uniref:hypothetical protein n=1 Tax=Actinoallomurus sp. NPDC052274 TaxID=3155420 RepID=UPI00341C61C2
MMTTLPGTPMMSPSALIITGGCPVWPLPHTRSCAEAARSIVRTALADLVPDRLDDCLVMASEYATNAWLHGLGGREFDNTHAPVVGRSELAIYRRGPEDSAELVVTVFDPRSDLDAVAGAVSVPVLDQLPDKPLNESLPADVLDQLLGDLPDNPLPESPPAAVGELPPQWWSGQRGLDTVRALSGGRYGFYRTRSRLGQYRVSGKVAWFTVPISATSLAAKPPAVRLSPAEAVRALRDQLTARGLGGMYHNDLHDRSVLSLRHLTIWCGGENFSWKNGDREAVRIPYFDLADAVEAIVRISEDHEYLTLGARS